MMKKTVLMLVLLGCSSLGLARTLATVNNEKIDSKVIEEHVALLKKQTNGQIQDNPQLRESILNRLVVHTVIVQEAKRLKLDQGGEYQKILNEAMSDAKKAGEDKKPNFKKEFDAFKENLLEQAYAVHIMESQPVQEAEVRKEYDNMKQFYQDSQEIQLAEIVTNSVSEAQKVLAALKKGENFSKVAKQYTIDPEGKKSGGLHQGYINLKDMQVGAPGLYQLISPLKKGEYTKEAIPANGIYAIFSVSDKRKAKIPAYEQLKDSITAQLQDEKIDRAIEALMKKADIKKN